MVAKKTPSVKTLDEMLKAILVFSRTADYVLEKQAVEVAVRKPISTSKVQILRLLGQRGAQTSTQVARFLGVTKPAVTQIIDSMVAAKLVTRRTAKHDRREVNLLLTSKGRVLHTAVHSTQRQYLRNALKKPLKHSAGRLVAMLHEISVALAGADQAFERFCAQCGAHGDGDCVLSNGKTTCPYLKPIGGRGRRARSSSSKR